MDKAKAIAIWTIIAAIVATGAFNLTDYLTRKDVVDRTPYPVMFTVSEEKIYLTEEEYQKVKIEMINRYLSGDEFEYYELGILAAVFNEEAKRGKFTNIRIDGNVGDVLINKSLE